MLFFGISLDFISSTIKFVSCSRQEFDTSRRRCVTATAGGGAVARRVTGRDGGDGAAAMARRRSGGAVGGAGAVQLRRQSPQPDADAQVGSGAAIGQAPSLRQAAAARAHRRHSQPLRQGGMSAPRVLVV